METRNVYCDKVNSGGWDATVPQTVPVASPLCIKSHVILAPLQLLTIAPLQLLTAAPL